MTIQPTSHDSAGNAGSRALGTNGLESVVVIDDHHLLSQTLVDLISQGGAEATAVQPVTFDQVVADAIAAQPQVALVAKSLSVALGRIPDITAALVAARIAVVVVVGVSDDLDEARCLQAGAAGFVGKGASMSDILDALGKAARAERLVDESRRQELLASLRQFKAAERKAHERFGQLTSRETEVLSMMCDGLSAAEMADDSYVSVATIRSQIRAILLKLGVSSQLAAAAYAHRAGWVDRSRQDASSSMMRLNAV